MRRRGFLASAGAAAVWLAARRTSAAAATTAKTIRVRLFKGKSLVRVSASGADANGVTQLYSFDADTTFKPMLIGGGVPLTINAYDADGLVATRRYSGTIAIAPDDSYGILIVNAVDLEHYVASVLANEISPSWPYEALKAQAVAARTYALHAARASTGPYDLGDDTSNQVYSGMDGIDPRLAAAANASAGQALYAGSELAEVFYSSACGGHTASATELSGRAAPAYLRGIVDTDSSGHAYCSHAPFFAWQNVVAEPAMALVFGISSDDLTGVDITSAWPDGRARIVSAHRRAGQDVVLDGRAMYGKAAEILGYKVIPSTLLQIAPNAGGYLVSGHGLGHGVGMCQWGARGRADSGANSQSILTAYFPGATLGSA